MTGDAQTTANILQLVLDLDELQQYYHVDEVPERKPLRILKNSFVENEPPLRKFGVPVVYQSQAQLQESGSAFLEFQRVDIQDDSASVLFTYPVEGVRGEVTLQHDADGWHVASHTLAET